MGLRHDKTQPFQLLQDAARIIRLPMTLSARFPLFLRNVEDLLHERGVDMSYATVRFWWHRFGAMFAFDIGKRRAEGMKSSHWRWHLDEVFMKIMVGRKYL